MNTTKHKKLYQIPTQLLLLLLPLVASGITGCSSFFSKQTAQTSFYAFEGVSTLQSAQVKSQTQQAIQPTNTLPSLIVTHPQAAAGFDTRRMMYSRSEYKLEYFARNELVDTPSHMLQPLMVSAVEQTKSYSAVIPKLPAAKTDLRLESEILSLLQDFKTQPSKVRFIFRATVIDNATGKIIALREFDEQVNATSDDPVGGVKATNQAVKQVLDKLGLFCIETAITWKRAHASSPADSADR
ncbi:MAG: hypothetical protein B7X95_00525 [Methylophilaceae bacterium 17-44-8]|nr:MAG: hypothetical protein B7Y48_04160 [Methylophilales bacterium 28-44-11]OZA06963.1 MAG: hypothetical protein B7X95_00525 [Methylophilaceae bacterium 17-44-8]